MAPATKPIAPPQSLIQWGLVVVLTAVMAIAALPAYLGSQWPWQTPLEVPNIEQLKTLKATPLALPGWQSTLHEEISISGTPWLLSDYRPTPGTPDVPVSNVVLLMRPQPWHNDQPEVEWVDITGSQGWQVSDRHRLQFSVAGAGGHPVTVTTRYFRGLNSQQTFAVMQWYAWPQGGHPAPGRWFWADQMRQWRHRERLPWVAVTLVLPIEPVGNIRPYADTAIAIAQAVQTSLMQTAFSEN